jgi:hypothetical protein
MRPSHALPPALLLVAAAGALAPGRVARTARIALAAYFTVLAFEAIRLSARDRDREARFTPLVLAVMHVAWGAGFVAGCVNHGPPLRALATLPRRALARPNGVG